MNYSICPTVTAYSDKQYKDQMNLVTSFANRIHIDYMDGQLAPTVSQSVHESWWPKQIKADLHLMYKYPMQALGDILDHHPNLVIVHAEADHVSSFVHELHEHRTKVGVALLQNTPVEKLHHFINVIDHVLVFSGSLGHHGGTADMALLDKVRAIKLLKPNIEIGWDGGITVGNIKQLQEAGVSVFNVGSTIHASDNPQNTYNQLVELVQS